MNHAIQDNQILMDIGKETLDELIQRIGDIDTNYCRISEKMGQLYMRADEFEIETITSLLDKPMRDASFNKLAFDALLEELKMVRNRHI
jgi:hypothetical protein